MPDRELEIKLALSAAQHQSLYAQLRAKGYTHTSYMQANHYFDTQDFYLRSRGDSLRVRQKEGGLVAQYKMLQRGEDGLWESLEYSSTLKVLPRQLYLHDVDTQIPRKLHPGPYFYLGNLTTYRHDFAIGKVLLSLDKSFYLGHVDYELEMEIECEEEAERLFEELGLTAVPIAKGKYGRFVESYKQFMGINE